MNTFNCLIVDDEPVARDIIISYCDNLPHIHVVAVCGSALEAKTFLQDNRVDIMFLDIHLPVLDGISLLNVLRNPPQVIFTTAYSQYAIQAFEMNAVDYLLKPFSKDRLLFALNKAVQRIQTNQPGSGNINKLIQHPLEEIIERVVVKSNTKISVIPVEKIVYLEAEDDYVMIFTREGKHLKQATMKYFEQHLDPKEFMRVHRSFIVRIDQVVQLEPYGKDSYVAKLKDGASVHISKSGFKTLKEKLNF